MFKPTNFSFTSCGWSLISVFKQEKQSCSVKFQLNCHALLHQFEGKKCRMCSNTFSVFQKHLNTENPVCKIWANFANQGTTKTNMCIFTETLLQNKHAWIMLLQIFTFRLNSWTKPFAWLDKWSGFRGKNSPTVLSNNFTKTKCH